MASKAEHCAETLEKLGNEFEEVHKWIDARAIVPKNGTIYLDKNHRVHRHHKEGVEEVRRKWGDKAADAAVMHIKRDMGEVRTHREMQKEYGKKPSLVKWKTIFGEDYKD